MTTISTGIDLVEIDRLRLLNPSIKARFLNRVFTSQELIDCAGKDQSLMGKFAAKEAAAKALGCGIGEVRWQDIEILLDEQHKPMLILHGKAREISTSLGWSSWSVSIAHTRDHAVATVTALIEKET